MLNSISFLLDLLRNKITTSSGTVVPVIKRSYPLDMSPCICLDDSPGASVTEKYKLHTPSEVLVNRTHSYVNIHLYCDNEDERDYLLGRIRQAVYMVEQDHYKYCSNFGENNQCSTLQATCPAIAGTRLKASKNQCPDPDTNEYENLFTKHHIIRDTFQIDPAFSTDDLTKHPPLLHSVLKTSMIYDETYNVGGTLSDDLKQNTTIKGA